MSEPVGELDPGFSSPGASARPWSDVEAKLTEAQIFWLSTVRVDGRPHVTPLPAVWTAGSLHFCTGPGEQKAKNLEANPLVALTTGTDQQNAGLDVVVEGRAVRVTDPARLAELARLWKERLDWDYTVSGDMFMPDDEHHAYVFGVAPAKVLAFGKGEPFTQTRFRFP
ncbi:pyridoxamine 5'-phosphate oxidase family protein [Actinoplanes sp. LDG1-06]|uniref:Pyridoxamine 5'-phosphate oxidase family protein n=1 Tax=Paractinoplanes ovalisporus TaxID=2810368 RepID=A0ABS2AJ70_9ACTN|nr:pyridoxamine 5'-phosphate oxidase family protein [Actinoplanes ovalisporus]MBM2619835.1 pyridoxamine 5'-phosphate oxidase family protein [Actinoplanes ovalisporus]